MELTDADLNNFQALYRKYFGLDLDRDTAYSKLSMLVRQMELVYQPITMAQLDQLKDVDGDDNAKTEHLRQ